MTLPTSAASKRGRRGSGVKQTLPLIARFAGLWMGVTVVAVLVASTSTYLLIADSLSEELLGRMTEILVVQTSLLVLAVFGLGMFTTHRLAGPWIAVRRALDDVADGNFARRLSVRQADAYLKEVEASFNEMMETVEQAVEGPAKPGDTNG